MQANYRDQKFWICERSEIISTQIPQQKAQVNYLALTRHKQRMQKNPFPFAFNEFKASNI